MDEDPLLGWGLRPVTLTDRAAIEACLASLAEPLSDYTFSQLYTWRNSLRIGWTVLRNHLCVFANGTGDLTLLLPPIGDGGSDAALREAFDLMDAYNAEHGVPDRSRVEYVSEELLARFDVAAANLRVRPMGVDYVYDTQRMIDLAGGDLAYKRQAKNRFMRNYRYRVEAYDPSKHLDACLNLLESWRGRQDAEHAHEPTINAAKRRKETLATELTLRCAAELGMPGMVVYVGNGAGEAAVDETGLALRAFTFGEWLGQTQSSITIEKTELAVKGLAQFIFSEFCRTHWARRPLVNVGDDWGLETLAWTKMSYRPAKLLQKYVVELQPATMIAKPEPTVLASASAPASAVTAPSEAPITGPVEIRAARRDDVTAAVELEQSCFTAHCLSKRQLQYLQSRESAVFLVAEHAGQVVGDCISLVRRHKRPNGRHSLSGRIYSLAVHQQSRGQKIGRRLLEKMIDELSTRGVSRLFLEVEAGNDPAITLYRSKGFVVTQELKDYYGEGRNGLHMMCELAGT